MSFQVNTNGGSWAWFKLKTMFGACGGVEETRSTSANAITNGQFSYSSSTYSFSGRFTSSTSATGNYTFTNFYHPACGYESQSGTWNASFQGSPPANTPTPTPTATSPAQAGIYGRATYNNASAAGIELNLRFYDGSAWSTKATTTTASDGSYRFAGVAPLSSGQKYYVRFGPNTSNSSYVSNWNAPEITTYSGANSIPGGDFDIADVSLLSPAHGTTLPLPVTFTWQKRAISTDTYRWWLYDPDSGNQWMSTNPLSGGSFQLSALPTGVIYGKQYRWYVRIYNGEQSSGTAFYYRNITFSASTFSYDEPPYPDAYPPEPYTAQSDKEDMLARLGILVATIEADWAASGVSAAPRSTRLWTRSAAGSTPS